MVGFHNPLSNLLHPSSSKPKANADSYDDAEGDEKHDNEPAVASKTSSSCEIFSMFKMMAAGKKNQQSLAEEVDSDEDEEGDLNQQPEPEQFDTSHSQADEQTLRHSGSSATVRVGESLYDEDEDDHDTVVGDGQEKFDTRRDWHKAYGQDTADIDAQGSRLAALHLGNMQSNRPPTVRSNSSFQTAREGDSEDEEPELGPPKSQSSNQRPGRPTLASTKSSAPSTYLNDQNELQANWEGEEKGLTETQKLQAIIEEFGEVSTLMENLDGTPGPSERIVAESHGSLYRGVMTIGNLHLTTHRLLFHAMLPPEAALSHAESGESSNQHHSIVHSGPVTIHRPGLRPPVRRWLELTADMVTSYPRADEAGRIRPIRCVLLSTVSKLEPFDPDHPNDFHVVYETPHGVQRTHMSVDTEQSAMQWRRAFEGALFRHAHAIWKEQHAKKLGTESTHSTDDQWTMMRACVPLDRIRISGMQDYHSFVTLLGLEIDLRDIEKVDFSPENDLGGDSDHEDHHKLHLHKGRGRPARQPQGSFGSEPIASPTVLSPKSRAPELSPTLSEDGKCPIPSRKPSQKSQNGVETPTKRFSLRNTLERALTPSHSRDPSPSPKIPTGPQWLDSTIPKPLAKAAGGVSLGKPEDWNEAGTDAEYSFNIAVQQEQTWFVGSLQQAVQESKQRKYKDGAKRPKMVLNVAGYDCLMTDEDLENPLRRETSHSSDSGDEHLPSGELGPDNKPGIHLSSLRVKAARKAEKATMAAKLFGLKEEEGIWLKRCFVVQNRIPYRGHLIVSPKFICFWRRATFGQDIKYRLKSSDVKEIVEVPAINIGYHGLALKVAGHHDLRLDFRYKASHSEAIKHIQTIIDMSTEDKHDEASSSETPSTPSDLNVSLHNVMSAPVRDAPEMPNHNHPADVLAPPKDALFKTRAWPDEALAYMPFVANRPRESSTRLSPRTFAMLTIGSRGDVQPYIALGLRLKKDGHTVVIITHDEFKDWVEGYGIIHRQAGGDPTALMKLSQEHAMFSPGFFKESLGSFRQWLDELLLDAWNACYDADVLIESPSAMAGIHIAEARHIPYFRAFTMPWTRTSAYPQAFMVPAFEMGPSFNYSTYVLFDNIIWAATSGQINKWRKEHLNLKSTDMSSLSITKVPFLYNFSSAVVPKPLDWRDDITITGYWNLEDSDTDWTPPEGLKQFMKKARDDGKALVYIGFGSIVVPRPNAMTKSIIKAVQKADVRAIIAKGWSSRGGDPAKEGGNIEFPDCCFGLEKVPHGWLFPRVDAALHHGGAGTVGASLRAGIPTLIKPWFGDQFFWANRVTKLEVGLKVPSLRSDEIASCLHKATTSTLMIEKAKRVGQLIRSESGVDNAVASIQYNIVRAVSDRKKMTYQ